jgi:hypothetical protein
MRVANTAPRAPDAVMALSIGRDARHRLAADIGANHTVADATATRDHAADTSATPVSIRGRGPEDGPPCVASAASRFGQDVAIHHHRRVGAEHERPRLRGQHGARLGLGQPRHVRVGRFARVRRFVHVGRAHGEGVAGGGEQFLATRRRGREHEDRRGEHARFKHVGYDSGMPPLPRSACALLVFVALAAPLHAQAPDATSPSLLPWSQQIAIREAGCRRRHAALLPMLRRHGISMWIVATEEFHDDPLVQHVAPPRPYVGNRDFFVFVDAGDAGLKRIAITGYTEDNLRQFFETGEPVPAEVRIGQLVDQYKPKTVGLAIGGTRGMTRSLTYDTYRMIAGAIGTPAGVAIVSAQDLIEEYADTRLASEMPHYRTAVQLTEALTRRALSSEVIRPGTTTVGEVRRWLYDALWAHGVRTWFQPDLRVQRRGRPGATSRGFLAVAPEATVIERGDVVHLDFGLSYMGFDTDWHHARERTQTGGPQGGDAHEHATDADAPSCARGNSPPTSTPIRWRE